MPSSSSSHSVDELVDETSTAHSSTDATDVVDAAAGSAPPGLESFDYLFDDNTKWDVLHVGSNWSKDD